MQTKNPITGFIFATIFAAAVGLAGFGFFSFQKDLAAVNKANQENISWSSMQLEIELLRFREAVHSYQTGAEITPKEVNKRFDILWSRVAIFQRGKVGLRLSSYDSESNILARLFAEIQNRASTVENIESASAQQLELLRQVLIPFSVELRHLSKIIFVGEEAVLSDIHLRMRVSANTTLMLSIVSVLFLLGALVYSIWQTRRFRILAHTNKVLADLAEKASQAKTRFLTMMSHELRTPMNGVLGLLALLRQSKTSDSQDNIIDQAERSANQMVGMLTDILEFSALQNDDITLKSKIFELKQLSTSLDDLFGPEARRAGIDFQSICIENNSSRLMGDFRRLKQIFAHLAGYFVDLAGLHKVVLEFGYGAGFLRVNIVLDYAEGGKAWTPDLILGERSDSEDSFAADALGPAVARGLITKMQGEIELASSEANRVVVAVSIPIEEVEISQVKVWLAVTSDVMASICTSALRGTPVEFVKEKKNGEAHVILYETGNLDDAQRVSQLQEDFPNALVVAIGQPINPDLFDMVIRSPAQITEMIGPIIQDLAS